ncbi:MAG: hypothetical protein ACYCT2_02315 [Thermoplasmataceae archaeon]
MLIKDVDQLLDMQCVISIRDGNELLDCSRRLSLKIPCTALVDNGKISILFFLKREESLDRDIKMFLETLGARNLGNSWVVNLSDAAIAELGYLRPFLKIPSVILDEVTLENGSIYARLRFHSNYLDKVSSEVMAISKKTGKISLEYLGKSGGLISVLRKIDQNIPLFYFSLEGEPPETKIAGETHPVSGKWIREIKFTADDLVRGLYAVNPDTSGLNFPLNEISSSDNLYEGPAKDDILEFVRKKTTESFIPTFSKVQGYDGKKMSMDFVVPEIELQKFLSVVSEILNAFPDWKINLSNAGKFSSVID